MATYNIPTWQTLTLAPVEFDTQYTVTTGMLMGNTIFSGTTLSGHSFEHIDNILANYVEPIDMFEDFHPMWAQEYEFFDGGWQQSFTITGTDYKGSTVDKVNVYYDWTYELVPKRPSLSDPPIPLIDYRMHFVWTILPNLLTTPDVTEFWISTDGAGTIYSKTFANLELSTGSPWTIAYLLEGSRYPADFSRAFNRDYYVWQEGEKIGATLYLKTGETFTVANTCKDYALYYRNLRGGWDWLVCEGISTQTDNYTRTSYTRKVDWNTTNNNPHATKNYMNQVKESWQLNTLYMTDEQAAKMHHLFASNTIYLQNLNTKDITPVNITDKSFTYKTFANQKKKLAQYTINVQSARDKKILH